MKRRRDESFIVSQPRLNRRRRSTSVPHLLFNAVMRVMAELREATQASIRASNQRIRQAERRALDENRPPPISSVDARQTAEKRYTVFRDDDVPIQEYGPRVVQFNSYPGNSRYIYDWYKLV